MVPTGFCHCGCGGRTAIAKMTARRYGRVKGQPVRYIAGHNAHPVTPAPERFFRYVTKTPECWEWTGYRSPLGYGRFNLTGTKPVLAHRFAWELQHGPIPDGLVVCHHCDNPRCVRPDHLFLGTQRDNLLDMGRKGRRRGTFSSARTSGEANRAAKLTVEEVRRIRDLAPMLPHIEIAAMFNICKTHVSKIVRRRTWKTA